MNSAEIKAEYTSSLADLTFNSKPLINVLTMLAEENLQNASDIVEAIEAHLSKVHTDVKLPILYLIDCIVKNVGKRYTELFSQNIVSTFCSVFKVVDERTRSEMFKLRITWNDIFPQKKLYAIDVQVKTLDPAWPVTAHPPSNSIHLNPKFLKNPANPTVNSIGNTENKPTNVENRTLIMHQKLIQKQKELLELQQKKLELELLQTKVKLRETSTPSLPNVETRKQQSVSVTNSKTKPGIATINQRNNSNTPKINPVNSALLTAKRPQKINRDPRLQKQAPAQNISQTDNSTQEQKHISVDKTSQRSGRMDPRLNNKESSSSQSEPISVLKSSQKSREHKPLKIPLRNSSKSSSDSLKSSSNSSIDSAEKKSERSPEKSPKSPSKNKKKEKEKYEDKKDKIRSKRLEDTSFKGIKNKNRSYMRRNRSPSSSPEPLKDEDLRSLAPPEKQIRIQVDAPEEKSVKDTDLRQIPTIGKKRSSTEGLEASNAKKSKTEVFDVLFGNEDTDLRKLPSITTDRPPTPPPPIISSGSTKADTSEVIEIVEDSPPKKNNNLDAIRAKLANVSNRNKIFSKSFNKKKMGEDQGHRVFSIGTESKQQQIIISTDDEQCIKEGKMTKERENEILNKIIMQVEINKLNEAKKKDHEQSFNNISLQTISDEELEITYSDDEKFKGDSANDKDDRLNGPQNYGSEENVTFPKFPPARWPSQPNWRGRRRHWDGNLPHLGPHGMPMRPPLRPPWIGPPVLKPWRPLGPPRHLLGPAADFGPLNNKDEDRGSNSPDASEMVVESVSSDEIKNINIDSVPRDVRYYDETAIIFMNWDDPREVSFQEGVRRVVFNDKDSFMLSFNEPYKDVLINGCPCKIRLGAPTREIYINNKAYECFIGGQGITIELNGVNTAVKVEGPPPQVKIGSVKRTDLVAGRINLIINAKILIPVFLDAKVQKIVIEQETHTLKFVDSLKTVLINDCPFDVEFGGLPKPVTLHGKKHFIRFSVLPKGIKPGHIRIKDMEGAQPSPIPSNENSRDGFEPYDVTAPVLPIIGSRKIHPAKDSPERNSNSPHFFQNLLQQNNLDNLLTSVMTSSVSHIQPASGGYQVEHLETSGDGQSGNALENKSQSNVSSLPPTLNVNELFQKLVATGIVTTRETTDAPIVDVAAGDNSQDTNNKLFKKNPLENVKLISFSQPESLKKKQLALYNALYSGMQCTSCGMRFPPEQSIHYSQHLDWHFRQNRKGKKNIRVATSRRWYYSLSDWKNYEEIEDLEEREKNFFDQQASQAETTAEEAEEEAEIPTVPSDADVANDRCDVCKDKFDQFFNEEKEEWHLRNAIRVDGKIYHPLCYDDYLASLQEPSLDESAMDTSVEQESRTEEIPGLQIILDDDEEEDEEKADEVIIDESEDSASLENKDNISNEQENPMEDDGDDDDVIINEVAPIKIVVDDDDDDEEMLESNSADPSVVIKKEKIEIDDGFEDVGGLISLPNGGHIKIKAEPVDSDDLTAMDTTDPEPIDSSLLTDKNDDDIQVVDQTPHTGIVSTIDGNVELDSGIPAATSGSKIKINISKPLPVIAPTKEKEITEKENVSDSLTESIIDPSQPLPPGEEPVQLNLKPGLQGVTFKKLPPVKKGSELSGLCVIM